MYESKNNSKIHNASIVNSSGIFSTNTSFQIPESNLSIHERSVHEKNNKSTVNKPVVSVVNIPNKKLKKRREFFA